MAEDSCELLGISGQNQSFKIAPTLYSLVLDSTQSYLLITLANQKLADVIDLKQAATLEGALISTILYHKKKSLHFTICSVNVGT
jgi:hypothetical protein